MKFSSFFLFGLFAVAIIFIQSTNRSDYKVPTCKPSKEFGHCAAILFEGHMLVNEYSPQGTCRLEQGMQGKLTLAAVTLTETVCIPSLSLTFRVALRDKETGTLLLLTPESVVEVEVSDLLKLCKDGDQLIIITEQKAYSLPHHTIDIFKGC